jgi:segregation and condensation protein A
VFAEADQRVKLPVFEGPLDLLLFLVRKNELDIYDIPIETVTRQYMEALRAMRELDLDVAGEFFVMAATLMEIKSRYLLPKGLQAVGPDAEDEEVDPRWELVYQLVQYKKFKEASAALARLAGERENILDRRVSAREPAADRPLRAVDRIGVWNAFNLVLRRLAEKLVVGEIHDEIVTVVGQMEWLLARIEKEPVIVFSSLFSGNVSQRRLLATFFAVLELTRIGKMRLRQDALFADIVCEAAPLLGIETAANPGTVPS